MDDTNKNIMRLKPKLLLIEDDIVAIDLVTRILKHDYDIDSVCSGEAALKKNEVNNYDAFLIDIGLPGKMNGIETTKKLKEIKNNKDKPYIAITAFAMAGDREFFISKGLTHYISKPFKNQKLKELIEYALMSTKMHNQ